MSAAEGRPAGGVGALVVLAFAALEGTFSLYLREPDGVDDRRAAYAFAFLGLVSALVQGGLIRRLVPRFGEPRLILVGLLALAAGWRGWLWRGRLAGAFRGDGRGGVGQALAGPSLSGLLSRMTPASEQGAIFGLLTAAGTFARMVNYVVANRLLGRLGAAAPFWEGAAVAGVAFGLAVWTLRGTRAGSGEVAVEVAAEGAGVGEGFAE